MGNILTTAILQKKGTQAFHEIISRLVVFDERGAETKFSEFIKTAPGYSYWVIYWNESGRERYKHAFSIFCFNNYSEDERAGYLKGILAESGRNGVGLGDFDEVNLVYIEKIQIATADRYFFFVQSLHRENKALQARLIRIEKRLQNILG